MDLLVHELGFQWGGAERVFAALAQLEPRSRLAVIAGRQEVLRSHLPGRDPEILVPGIRSNGHARAAVPYLAYELPKRDLRADRVLLSSYAMCRWLPSRSSRLIYCHAPMRQIWHGFDSYAKGWHPEAVALRRLAPWLRSVDQTATQPDDLVIVPSPRVADLVNVHHGLVPTAVIPPPVDNELFEAPFLDKVDDYFVWVGRVVEPVKQLGSLLNLFQESVKSHRLVVVGDGRSRAGLQRKAPQNVSFVGWRSPAEITRLVGGATGLILPSMEDFGVAAAEALALGTPVIVSREAGISHWVSHGHNGWLIDGTEVSFVNAIRAAASGDCQSQDEVRKSAESFRLDTFLSQVRQCMTLAGWK